MKKLLGTVFCLILLSFALLLTAGCAPSGTGLRSKSMSKDGDSFHLTLPNHAKTFSFENEFKVAKEAKLYISDDEHFSKYVENTVDLAPGNNTFYICVKNGDDKSFYTAVIRRRPIYTVTFDAKGGADVAEQLVEEGETALLPDVTPERLGCTFTGWDHDFSNPIERALTVTAQYESDENMKPFLFESNKTECKITGVTDKNLTEAIIPDVVTAIGAKAFTDCTKLTRVTMANSVKSIGTQAFYFCSTLTEITLSDNLEALDDGVFEGCNQLKSIAFGKNLRSIGENAFVGCYFLKEITIPEGVTSIGARAFLGCTSLKKVILPESLTELGGGVFNGCTSLSEINLPSKLTSIQNGTFYECKSLKAITLPAGITSIGSGAFWACTGLTEIVIPDGVKELGDNAFWECTGITEIVIPDKVTKIGMSTFCGCTALKKVTLGSGVKSIKRYAFADCTSLTKVIVKEKDGWSAGELTLSTSTMDIPSRVASFLSTTYASDDWARTVEE